MQQGYASIPPLSSSEMASWSRFIQEISGVFLDQSKAYLIQSRAGSLLRKTGSNSWSELLQKVRYDAGGELRNELINSITTNETSFFRDHTPFELLRNKLIPDLIDRRAREGYRRIPIRIFSAACSTGQEIYSTIITLKELLGNLDEYDILVTGVDISDRAVSQASSGIFSNMEVSRGLSPERLSRFFNPTPEGYKIKDEFRFLASFRKGNLLQPMAVSSKFDIVFCRNVGIYFNQDDRHKLFQNMGLLLKDDGALIIGSTETVAAFSLDLEEMRHLRTVFYKKKTTADFNRQPSASQSTQTNHPINYKPSLISQL
ncbi:MAG: protein-glutamate O-methyltransferase CheR [Balneolaceae bacterium]|nr:MAG: protein-glutamate O-methyltransferase CheR [Balneolaceae bacterium]